MSKRTSAAIAAGAVLFLAAAAFPSASSPEILFIKNAKIMPVTAPPIEGGGILIENGRIARFGAGLVPPAGVKVIDAGGHPVYPGMISTLTNIGLIRRPGAGDDLNEIGTSTAQVDPFDALNPEDDSIEVARLGGVTSALTISGTRNVINGKSVLIKLDGHLAEDMVVRRYPAQIFQFRVRGQDRYPSTLPGVMAFIRSKFEDVRRYRNTAGKPSGDAAPGIRRDFELEALIPVLDGDVAALFLTHDALSVRSALTLIEEFGLRGVIFARAGVLEFADRLAEKNIPVIWAGATTTPGPGEPYDINFRTAAGLARKGVLFAFEKIVGEPDGRNSPRNLPVPAALSVAHGLSEDDAIRALTINPARILGVEKDTGSIEVGKTADLVIWSGSPIQMTSRVLHVVIGGRAVPLESIQTRLRDKYERIVRERMGKSGDDRSR